MHNPCVLLSFLKDETISVSGPCTLTWCSCQAAAVGWERGPLRPAGGGGGSDPGHSTAVAPGDCRQRQRSQLGANGSGKLGTKGKNTIWRCEMWTSLHEWEIWVYIHVHKCDVKIHLTMGYERSGSHCHGNRLIFPFTETCRLTRSLLAAKCC